MISFDTVGSGRPVVFIHSGLADRTMWSPQLVLFSEHFTCFAVDLPGYGQSRNPDAPFSHAAELGRFIRDSVGEPAALIGSSFGALQALQTAHQFPDWTGPLVLVDGLIMLELEISPALETVFVQADAAAARGEYDLACEIEIAGWVDGHGRPGGRAAESVRAYFRRTNRAIWQRHREHPLPDRLPEPELALERIHQPVLLIDGPYDFSEVHQSNRTLLSRLPRAIALPIDDTAHFPSYERPVEFNSIVLDFLSRTWGARAL